MIYRVTLSVTVEADSEREAQNIAMLLTDDPDDVFWQIESVEIEEVELSD